ncbi:MAG: MarC family protein [Bacteroidales bacterium]
MGNLVFDLKEFISAFVVLFAIIDITGSVPVVISLKSKGANVNPGQAATYSLIILTVFLFVGEVILKLFGVDIQSFAVAGSLIIFAIAMEMILGIDIFKYEMGNESTSIVPLVFPLIAGAGSFTALISLRAEYNVLNILLALAANMAVVYIVLRSLTRIERLLGKGGVYILRKFFGIILLAISVKLFTSNIALIISAVYKH